MTSKINQEPAPGWLGGFEESNALFSYPNPNLSSLHILDNMANVDKLQRQQAVLWPEFSWETQKDETNTKRCYQMFAPDISRIGYTDEGRVFSIICPQQGAYSPTLGSLNVEVTVTGQRGWVNESTKKMAADMSVVGKVWFSPNSKSKDTFKVLEDLFKLVNLPFPITKTTAIVVKTYEPGNPQQLTFPLRSGPSKDFDIPDFAQHKSEAWDVASLGVEIGGIEKVNHEIVDDFNQLFMDIFNLASGNMLQNGNVLSWDVWFEAPEIVDQKEWSEHAKKWRDSIDVGHGSPDGEGVAARYYDGTSFNPLENLVDLEKEKIEKFLNKHFLALAKEKVEAYLNKHL
jgi:hypothetical protein